MKTWNPREPQPLCERKICRPRAGLQVDHITHRQFLYRVIQYVTEHPTDLFPALQDFKNSIDHCPRLHCLAIAMFKEYPSKRPYSDDPVAYKHVMDYELMYRVLNHLLSTAPEYIGAVQHIEVAGLPILALFDGPMGTPSGQTFFLDTMVNRHLKRILGVWGEMLKTAASVDVLCQSEQAWLGPTSLKNICAVANGPLGTSYKFEEFFVCDPTADHFGFRSWDEFFTRRIRHGVRPIAEPDNNDVINNPCEARSYRLSINVTLRNILWFKAQPYRIEDMLAHDDFCSQFSGGTVYQAFLSALTYHRWHSPVRGIIKKAYVADGTYFAESPVPAPTEQVNRADVYDIRICSGQAYLTNLATRGILFIEADNPAVGLMAFVAVGMAEVSTCEFTVKEGQRVEKGEETGMFHFGGSSFCLMFRKGVNLEDFPSTWALENTPVCGKLAVVKK